MKKLFVMSAMLVAMTAYATPPDTYTGVVSDAMCAKNPEKASAASHAACAEKCIKGGTPAVLIVGKTVYSLSNPDKLAPYAGKTVTVEGTVNEGKLTVASVKE